MLFVVSLGPGPLGLPLCPCFWGSCVGHRGRGSEFGTSKSRGAPLRQCERENIGHMESKTVLKWGRGGGWKRCHRRPCAVWERVKKLGGLPAPLLELGKCVPHIKGCFGWQRHPLSVPLPSCLEPGLLVPTSRVTTLEASGLSPGMGTLQRHPIARLPGPWHLSTLPLTACHSDLGFR